MKNDFGSICKRHRKTILEALSQCESSEDGAATSAIMDGHNAEARRFDRYAAKYRKVRQKLLAVS